jgi:hypothetical protein
MLRRDPTPLALNEFDVQDVRKAMAERFHAQNGPPTDAAEEPVNALDQAKKKKEGKSTAQRIGLNQ